MIYKNDTDITAMRNFLKEYVGKLPLTWYPTHLTNYLEFLREFLKKDDAHLIREDFHTHREYDKDGKEFWSECLCREMGLEFQDNIQASTLDCIITKLQKTFKDYSKIPPTRVSKKDSEYTYTPFDGDISITFKDAKGVSYALRCTSRVTSDKTIKWELTYKSVYGTEKMPQQDFVAKYLKALEKGKDLKIQLSVCYEFDFIPDIF